MNHYEKMYSQLILSTETMLEKEQNSELELSDDYEVGYSDGKVEILKDILLMMYREKARSDEKQGEL